MDQEQSCERTWMVWRSEHINSLRIISLIYQMCTVNSHLPNRIVLISTVNSHLFTIINIGKRLAKSFQANMAKNQNHFYHWVYILKVLNTLKNTALSFSFCFILCFQSHIWPSTDNREEREEYENIIIWKLWFSFQERTMVDYNEYIILSNFSI